MSIEAMKQALEALENFFVDNKEVQKQIDDASLALRQAIAEAEKQEPVAMQMDVIVVNLVREGINKHRARELAEHFVKHTHPQPKREWVGLTDEERHEIREWQRIQEELGPVWSPMMMYLYLSIDAKLKEKNT